MPPMPVQIVTAAPAPVEQVGEFVATIKSRRSTTIQPQAEGFLRRILVRSGASVSPGTPLFEVDATTQRAAVAGLESIRAARQADADFARQQATRTRTLLTAGAASQQEVDQAEAQLKTAEAQLKAAEEQIRQQQAELDYYRVVAPTAGVVGDIPVREGERVTRATVLTTVEDNAGLEAYINVPVQQAANLRIGLPVRILDEAGGAPTTTRANFIATGVDDATQSVLVKAPVPERSRLRADQFVRAEIVWSTEPLITIPIVSVVRINGQHFAFVAESANGGLVAKQRPLTLGPVRGDVYVVTAGIKTGDKVILAGTQKIGDGAPVQAMPAGPPAGAPAGRGAGQGGGA